jgi:hypothetical protein
MSVNKIQIRFDTVNDNNFIKIPLSLKFNDIGQPDVIDEQFTKLEIEKSINPIIDYEKARFIPIKYVDAVNSIDVPRKITDLTIKLNLLDKDKLIINNTAYGDIGFEDNDIKYRKNKFLNTFLRLNFYDSDITTNQNLVSSITIFSKVTIHDIDTDGLPINANDFLVRYILSDPISKPMGFAEGFYIYNYKVETLPRFLYMRAEFNNASTGKTTRLTTTSDVLPINLLLSKLHVRYLLTRTVNGYYYAMDNTYNNSTNISESETGITLNLYEIQVS